MRRVVDTSTLAFGVSVPIGQRIVERPSNRPSGRKDLSKWQCFSLGRRLAASIQPVDKCSQRQGANDFEFYVPRPGQQNLIHVNETDDQRKKRPAQACQAAVSYM